MIYHTQPEKGQRETGGILASEIQQTTMISNVTVCIENGGTSQCKPEAGLEPWQTSRREEKGKHTED